MKPVIGKSLIALIMLTGKIGILIFGFTLSNQELSLKREKYQEPAL